MKFLILTKLIIIFALAMAWSFVEAIPKLPRKKDVSDACARAAMCSLLRADIDMVRYRNTTSKSYSKFIEKATANLQKLKAPLSRKVKEQCEDDLIECEIRFKSEVAIIGYPYYLVAPCSIRQISYTVFLCKNIKNWPEEVTRLAPKGFTKCRDVCPTISELNDFHLLRNPKVIFPTGWEEHLSRQIKINAQRKVIADQEVQKPERRNVDEGFLSYRTIYVFERSRDGTTFEKIPSVCPEGTYLDTMGHFLPTQLFGKCVKHGKDRILQKIVITSHDQQPKKDAKRNVQCSGGPGNYQKLVIGLKFKTLEVYEDQDAPDEGTVTVLYESTHLCSGEDKFRDFNKGSKDSELDDNPREYICPPLTAVCMLQGYFMDLRLQKGGPLTSVMVNLRFGCCAMDPKHWYTSIPIVHGVTYKTMKGVDAQERADDGTTSQGSLEWTPWNYCPIGSFIFRFYWQQTIPNIVIWSNNRYAFIHRQTFYCNDYGQTHGPDGIVLSPNMNEAFVKNADDADWRPNTVGDFRCKSGFFRGGMFSVQDIFEDNFNTMYEYKMKCHDEWVGSSYNTNDYNLVIGDDYARLHFGNRYTTGFFECPVRMAICGIRTRSRGREGNHITPHGPYFEFICCPIPVFWPPYDCKSTEGAISYDLVRPETDCAFQVGQAQTCYITEGVEYVSTETNNVTKTNGRRKRRQAADEEYIGKYGFTLTDKLNAIVQYPKRRIGANMKDLLDRAPNTGIVIQSRKKRELGHARVKRAEPISTSIFIAISLISALSSIFTAGINKIPVGGATEEAGPSEPSRSISFSNSIKHTKTSKVQVKKDVDPSQLGFFYDVILKCGGHRLHANQKIRYITPSYHKCVVEDRFEFVQRYVETKAPPGQPTYTETFRTLENLNYGVGLFINEDGRSPLERLIKWDKLTRHVKLAFSGNFKTTRIDEDGSSINSWAEYSPNVQLVAEKEVPRGATICIYRVIAACGPYELYTDRMAVLAMNKTSDPCPDGKYGSYPDLFHADRLKLIPNLA